MWHWRALAVGAAVCAIIATLALTGTGGAPLAAALRDVGLAPKLHSTTITINGTKPGRTYYGVGAISGGGGTARLLIDYPEPERSQILDYLFKPGYGADVQVLKMEIGGDAEATDAAEPSFEHTPGHINCNAGYEIWLAQQAVALNPHIVLYALQWNAPGWVGDGQENPWTQTDIDYLMSWMNCAKQAGLNIAYLGGWNEHRLLDGVTPTIMNWFIDLRAALDTHGYASTKIVALDTHVYPCCDFAQLLASHPRFSNAIGVLGYHDICRYPTTGNACYVPQAAKESGKPIWATEIGALRPPGGTAALARTINNTFIQADVTATIEYPLVTAMPAGMPEEDRGLVSASQPWSGYYDVPLTTWVFAQTTQVTQPGWAYVDGADGQLGGGNWGTYDGYMPKDKSAWSLVVQTSDASRAQDVTVHIKGGLPGSAPVQVWSTNLNSPDPSQWFTQGTTITPAGGSFTATLQPGYIYSFTTTTGQGKCGVGGDGSACPVTQPPTAMPLPYSTTASGTTWPQSAYGRDASGEPWGLEAADGSFEYPSTTSPYFEQTTVGEPDFWQPPASNQLPRFPYALVGDYCMGDLPITQGTAVPADCGASPKANYTVSATVTFTAAGQKAGVIARYYRPVTTPIQYFYGYRFTMWSTGRWYLIQDNLTAAPVTLATGSYAKAAGVGKPHTLSLNVNGSLLTAKIDGHVVDTLTNSAHPTGIAGICTGGWYPVQFDNLTVTSP